MTRLLLVALGLAGSGMFFAWVSLQGSLPYLPTQLGWPWGPSDFLDRSLGLKVVWNVGLIQLFGMIHSLFAQLPRRPSRPLYVAISGVTLALIPAFWQPTGIVLWRTPGEILFLHAVSITLFLFFWLGAIYTLAQVQRFDEFMGLRENQSNEEVPSLRTSGAYGWVRHPAYVFTLLAFFIAPWMSLDRALVGLGVLIYLFWGIPWEERKLVTLFGDAYRQYQRKVPALFSLPRGLFRRKKTETS